MCLCTWSTYPKFVFYYYVAFSSSDPCVRTFLVKVTPILNFSFGILIVIVCSGTWSTSPPPLPPGPPNSSYCVSTSSRFLVILVFGLCPPPSLIFSFGPLLNLHLINMPLPQFEFFCCFLCILLWSFSNHLVFKYLIRPPHSRFF
jgi:hypothetical protein